MLPPDKNDRIITHLPKCCSPKAALQTKDVFHPRVKAACQMLKEDAVSFNFAKVIVVGDVSVGKTCLVSRFSRGDFGKNYKATIGVDFDTERFRVLGVPFGLQLWDTAGQERFKCIASTYYRGAQAIMVVFDLSRESSLAQARRWLEDAVKENAPSGVLLFLVGTKKDLSSPERLAQVEREAVRMAEEIRAEYWAVSAKSGAASFSLGPSTRRTNKRSPLVGHRGRRERPVPARGRLDLRGQRPARAGEERGRERRRRHPAHERPRPPAPAGQEEARLLLK